MSSINKVIIVGRLGNDPDVRQFQNGGNVTHISVATSERWNDKSTGERREQTEWHRISLFNRLGEISAQYLRKGSLVYIEGRLQTRKYTDQQGIERHITEIIANDMRMLGGNSGQATGYDDNHSQHQANSFNHSTPNPQAGYTNHPPATHSPHNPYAQQPPQNNAPAAHSFAPPAPMPASEPALSAPQTHAPSPIDNTQNQFGKAPNAPTNTLNPNPLGPTDDSDIPF